METKKSSKRGISDDGLEIFIILLLLRIPLSIKQISERTKLSWPRVKQQIKLLEEDRYIKIDKTKKKTRISIHPRMMRKEEKRDNVRLEKFREKINVDAKLLRKHGII